MSDNRESRPSDRPTFNARSSSRSTSRTRHVSQPILPSNSSHKRHLPDPQLSSGAKDMEALFDRIAPSSSSNSADRSAHANNPPLIPSDRSKAKAPTIVVDPGTPDTSAKSARPTLSGAKLPASTTATSSSSADKMAFDEQTVRQLLLFTKMQQTLGLVPPPAINTPVETIRQPTLRELTNSLYKNIAMVPKLDTNGTNYHTWLVMLRQALEGVLDRAVLLDDPDLILDITEDSLLKTAMLATINDNLKVSVAEQSSGLDGLRLISETFTLRSRTSHIAAVKDILEMKFNLIDRSADMDNHFRRIENAVKNLFRSGFVVSEESLVGLFFHLSLPNLEGFPFVNVARQIDQRMDRGDPMVRNTELVRLAKTELTLYRQNQRGVNKRKDRGTKSSTVDTAHDSKPSPSKWCARCRMSNHNTSDCTRGNPTSNLPSNNLFRNNAQGQTHNRAATAPPRTGFQANSAELASSGAMTNDPDLPVLQSVTLDDLNPQVTQEEIDELLRCGGRLFGLDFWEDETL